MKLQYDRINWIKQSLIFSFSITIITTLAIITTGAESSGVILHAIEMFLVIFLVSWWNIELLMYFKSEDPLKSPLIVKILSILGALLIFLSINIFHRLLAFEFVKLHGDLHLISKGNAFLYFFIQSILLNFIIQLWLYFLMSQHFKVQVELEMTRLAKAKSEAANQLLRQQIQPHFLFNALSTLKALVRKDADLAEKYIICLSDFLRVSVLPNEKGLSDIQQEIKLCRDYLEMQKIRFKDALIYHIDLQDLDKNYAQIPIFSLQPLVDNAIKHNQLTKEEPLCIRIFQQGDWVIVENNVQLKNHVLESNKMGLINLEERYRILNQAIPQVIQTETAFTVKIKLINHEHSTYRR